MSHSKRGRLDPKKTRKEVRRREREVGVRRRIHWAVIIPVLAVVAFFVTYIILYIVA